MTHERFSSLIDSYLRQELSQEDRLAMEAQQASCPDCALKLQIRQDSQQLDAHSPLPAGFGAAWRQAVYQEEADNMEHKPEESKGPQKHPFRFRRWMAVAAALVLVVGGTLLSRDLPSRQRYDGAAPGGFEETSAYGGYAPESAYPQAAVMADRSLTLDAASPAADKGPLNQSKIIRTVSLGLNTRAFEEDLKKLNDAIASHGGYVELSDVSVASGSRRSASITARIPKAQVDSFLEQIQHYGRLSNMTQSQEDVSEQYLDVDTRLKTQTAKMARLQELLGHATKVEDILSIEGEIANTQYQIDSLTGSLRGMDSRVDYSSVRITLSEQALPSVPEKQGLGERIRIALSDAWMEAQDFLADALIFLVLILPYLVLALILIVIIRLIVKRRKNK